MTEPLRVLSKSPPLGPFGRGPLPFPFSDPRSVLAGNGRTAIWMGLRALGMAPGTRVLVPAWHCGSEIDAIIAAGGVPVPYRLNPDLSADLNQVRALLGQGAGVLYVIHYFGVSQPMKDLAALAHDAGALLVEDLALGLYSTGSDGAPLGQTGDMAIFSLVKTLAVPDGGALWLRTAIARDALVAPPLRRTFAGLRSLRANSKRKGVRDRNAGQDDAALDLWNSTAGFAADAAKHRASKATRWLVKVIDHQAVPAHRRATYLALAAALPASGAVRPLLPALPAGACPAFFPLWADDPNTAHTALMAANIEPVRFWRRFHPGMDLADFPEAAALKRHVIRLPIHDGIDANAIKRIAAACEGLDARGGHVR